MIILASGSPRRRELMSLITDNFKVVLPNANETLPNGIKPADAVIYLSGIKAQSLADDTNIIIGADTVVAADNMILGKPQSRDDAYNMLKLLSGRVHSVFTGVTLIKGSKRKSFFAKTDVAFFELTDDDINSYLDKGESYDKAGAYGIQGYGALLVEKINGDYFNVVGLPVSRLAKALVEFK